jgi:hypothetical protein
MTEYSDGTGFIIRNTAHKTQSFRDPVAEIIQAMELFPAQHGDKLFTKEGIIKYRNVFCAGRYRGIHDFCIS